MTLVPVSADPGVDDPQGAHVASVGGLIEVRKVVAPVAECLGRFVLTGSDAVLCPLVRGFPTSDRWN